MDTRYILSDDPRHARTPGRDNVTHLPPPTRPIPAPAPGPIVILQHGQRLEFPDADALLFHLSVMAQERQARCDKALSRIDALVWDQRPAAARLQFVLVDALFGAAAGIANAVRGAWREMREIERLAAAPAKPLAPNGRLDVRALDGFRSDGPPAKAWRRRRRERWSDADLTLAGAILVATAIALAFTLGLPGDVVAAVR